jgi:hypothetical protein
MSDRWLYQIRVELDETSADIARRDPHNVALKALTDILKRHRATMVCQFDAFADFIADAMSRGDVDDPLFKWTKDTIDDPAKQRRYRRTFAIHIDGEVIYSKKKADALETELQPIVGKRLVTRVTKIDTNPATTPQPPARY